MFCFHKFHIFCIEQASADLMRLSFQTLNNDLMEENRYFLSRPIILTYLNGTGYTFNFNDYIKIRNQYRIIGNLCGKGLSPDIKVLPAEYNQWETHLLVEKGIAILVKKSVDLLKIPSESDLILYKQEAEQKIKDQSEYLKAGLVRASLKNIDKIVAGKINKSIGSDMANEKIEIDKESIIKEIEDNYNFNEDNATIEVPMQYQHKYECQKVRLPILDSLKYKVFMDLWEKNKFITSGETFGGDFLVYPGDPMLFHASHIIIILEKPKISPPELIAKCRLAVIVNKHCVFAYFNDKHQINYQTVKWIGSCKTVNNVDLNTDVDMINI